MFDSFELASTGHTPKCIVILECAFFGEMYILCIINMIFRVHIC